MRKCIDQWRAWLLDPSEKRVGVHRPGLPVKQRDDPSTLRGDPVLPGVAPGGPELFLNKISPWFATIGFALG